MANIKSQIKRNLQNKKAHERNKSVVEASKQEIAWTDVDSTEGFWMFQSESATVNGKTLQLDGNTAIVVNSEIADMAVATFTFHQRLCDITETEIIAQT